MLIYRKEDITPQRVISDLVEAVEKGALFWKLARMSRTHLDHALRCEFGPGVLAARVAAQDMPDCVG